MIDFKNVAIQFTGNNLFEAASFKILGNDKIALAGSNGSGKTTLLRLMTKSMTPSEGTITFQKNMSIGYLPQEFINSSSKSLVEEVRSSLKFIAELESDEAAILEKLQSAKNESEKESLIERLSDIEDKKTRIGYYSINSQIEKVLSGLGFSESEFQHKVNEFSGGWQMRIEIAKILLGNHNLILFDEPTNHLDIDSQEWLIEYLRSYKKAYIIVSHDISFLDSLTEKTIEIFNKRISFFNGKYSNFLKLRDERDKQLMAMYKNQEKIIKQQERFIERFRYKNTKAKQVQSRIKQLDKLESIELPDFEKDIKINFPDPPSSGAVPLVLENVEKSFGEKLVFKGIDLQLEKGDKIAFVGSNGSGKTTLAKIIAKQLDLNGGTITYGHNTEISYYAQEVYDALNLDSEVIDIILESAPDLTAGRVRNLLGAFLFNDDEVFKKVGVLSGGEKSRVALAKILVERSNLIVLDEPTNHLDYKSKKVLQKAIEEFPGTVIIVSHDIDFLKPIANKVFELKNKSARLFYGGIEYYLFKRREISDDEIVESDQSEKKAFSKKDQKRNAAEKRQKKFAATKNLKKEIAELEKKIQEFEADKSNIETELASTEVYQNPDRAKEKNKEYEEVKQNLDAAYSVWTEKTMELEEIESQFED